MSHGTSNEKIGQHAADEFRVKFGLGVEPIANLARLIEGKMGVGVAYVSSSAPGHGMTMRLGERCLMTVGCTENPMRLRSTLAHELGHLCLGSVDRKLDHSAWSDRTPEEIQADAFARHLLVPLAGVMAATRTANLTPALLSDLVQKYKASPNIVAIQLRNAGVIDQRTYREWSTLSTGRLASQFGWHSEYASLATESQTPRAPQALMARAIEGYRWGLVAPATISRLEGQRSPRAAAAQLEAEGIAPIDPEGAFGAPPERPVEANAPLTAEELAQLMDDTD